MGELGLLAQEVGGFTMRIKQAGRSGLGPPVTRRGGYGRSYGSEEGVDAKKYRSTGVR
jgi:hypothetical protein